MEDWPTACYRRIEPDFADGNRLRKWRAHVSACSIPEWHQLSRYRGGIFFYHLAHRAARPARGASGQATAINKTIAIGNQHRTPDPRRRPPPRAARSR